MCADYKFIRYALRKQLNIHNSIYSVHFTRYPLNLTIRLTCLIGWFMHLECLAPASRVYYAPFVYNCFDTSLYIMPDI